jgi:2-C-methyl-D-erythritol 4-phosphate cytidylyltransferase
VRVAAIVPAAGRGERLGAGAPKALRTIGGEPIVVHAVRGLRAAELVDLVVVAAPAADVAAMAELLTEPGARVPVDVVAGGADRQESVALALAALPPDVDIVLVHDAARPLTPATLINSVVAAVRGGAVAVVPGLPVSDTVKRVRLDGGVEVVAETVARADLRAIQTPQGFDRTVLEKAHAAASSPATDDAGIVEALGYDVLVVPGSADAFKITEPRDLLVAEAVLRERSVSSLGER